MFGWFDGPGWSKEIANLMGMAVAGHHVPEWLAMAVPITEFVGGAAY